MAILRAKDSFAFVDATGNPRIVGTGDLVASDDPLVKGRESFFERVEAAARRLAGIEEATAEPGAVRSVGRPRKVPTPAEPKPAVAATPEPKPS